MDTRHEDEGWVEAFKTNDEVEAVILRDLLLSAGLDVRGESLRVSQYPVTVGSLGEIVLYVKEHELADAEELIREFERSEPIMPDEPEGGV